MSDCLERKCVSDSVEQSFVGWGGGGGTSTRRASVMRHGGRVWSLGNMLSVWLCSLLTTHHVKCLGRVVHDCWPACLSSIHAEQPRMCLYECVCLCGTCGFCKTDRLGCVMHMSLQSLYICVSGVLYRKLTTVHRHVSRRELSVSLQSDSGSM